jgi:hypothetical protein
MKVTRREAFLLFVMGLFAIAGVMIAFVILPLNNKIDANKIILSGLESQKTIVDATLPLEPILKLRRQELLKDVSNELNKIETPMSAAQFDRWMLPLISVQRVIVIEATFEQTSIETPNAIVSEQFDPLYKIRNLILEFNAQAPPVSDIPVTISQLLHSRSIYRLETDFELFNRITREISSWNTSIFLNEATYDFAKKEAILTLDVYTIHKLLPEENPKDYSGDFVPGRDSIDLTQTD